MHFFERTFGALEAEDFRSANIRCAVATQRQICDSSKWSFFACLKNIGSFLIYGIVWMLLAIVATIPLGLGWLVLGPMTIASVYTAYRDIFFVRPLRA